MSQSFISKVKDTTATDVKDVTLEDGKNVITILAQILLELRVLNYQIGVLNSGVITSKDDTDAIRSNLEDMELTS